jgi:hypothetical protein
LAEKQFSFAKGDQIEVAGSRVKFNSPDILSAGLAYSVLRRLCQGATDEQHGLVHELQYRCQPSQTLNAQSAEVRLSSLQ